MKESRILKLLSYLMLIILIAILGLSIFTIGAKDNIYYNKEKYFSSQAFVDTYMGDLENEIIKFIHNNEAYNSIQDNNIRIYYSSFQEQYSGDIKNKYFLMIYENKAFTNVELTSQTNTIENIKNYIKENKNSKTVNIINGEIQSESQIIQKIGIQYLNDFTEVYYTIEDGAVVYKSAEPHELQIYSSYVEEFEENSELEIRNKLLTQLLPFEKYTYFLIPISAILIILILVYLIISTGYKKGIEGIYLNDFDKIPLEFIIAVGLILGGLFAIPLLGINTNNKAIISLITTESLVIYILCVIILNTIIKRIKVKAFWRSTLTGKIIIWISKFLEKLYSKYISIFNTVTYSTKVTAKVFIYFGLVIPIGIFIFIAFNDPFTVLFLELILMAFVGYRIIKTSKGFAEIENKLKEMYEGNNKTPLNKQDFGIEFQSTVKYINDISNGFENAIQDRMKSERMKAELITNVSHDIKTPLTSIINYVDLLKQENIQNEKAKEYIEILDNKSQRLKKLTEDLVEASKVSTGNISLNIEKINVVELIKQALGEFEDKFKKHGLEIIIDSNDNEVNINADSRYMYRIIENLFSNISKYALENSRVYIDIKKTQEHVKIELKNISKQRLNISADELMQRFVRGDKSRTTEGSGLGISIAQNLTELQNGEFKLKLDGDLFKVELKW